MKKKELNNKIIELQNLYARFASASDKLIIMYDKMQKVYADCQKYQKEHLTIQKTYNELIKDYRDFKDVNLRQIMAFDTMKQKFESLEGEVVKLREYKLSNIIERSISEGSIKVKL